MTEIFADLSWFPLFQHPCCREKVSPVTMVLFRIATLALLISTAASFAPKTFVGKNVAARTQLKMFDPSVMDVSSVNVMMESASQFMAQQSSTLPEMVSTFMDQSSNLISFADQGQNLAGTFFQASLLPYLLFLYFLSFRANRINNIGNFGFQYILLFVFSTIPSGIISRATYGTSLANVDWLHGGAELLLTVANVLLVFGFKEASTNPNPPEIGLTRKLALATFGTFIAAMALGPSLGFGAHSEFLFGAGDLPTELVQTLPWVSHGEPINALSIPTWMIHFSSVIEYLVAMSLVWKFSEVTNNEKWKGLTWGMLPLHASGICACTYHFFYNPSSLQFLVSTQAGLTLLGNITCMIAAYRIAVSNGWTLDEINPFPKSGTNPTGLVADGVAAMPLVISEPTESNQILAAKVLAVTVVSSYLVKYGELGLDLPFTPNAYAAVAMVIGIPGITAYQYYQKSQGEGEGEGFKMNFLGDKTLSMADVKKYGVSGTVAYVLTELAFWAVAFPVASSALYETTGHWPDVINDTSDRTAVLGFIFAGANIARLLVPLRLGAALALAPWVDENILGGKNKDEETETETSEL